jgi:hypothetical protein
MRENPSMDSEHGGRAKSVSQTFVIHIDMEQRHAINVTTGQK